MRTRVGPYARDSTAKLEPLSCCWRRTRKSKSGCPLIPCRLLLLRRCEKGARMDGILRVSKPNPSNKGRRHLERFRAAACIVGQRDLIGSETTRRAAVLLEALPTGRRGRRE